MLFNSGCGISLYLFSRKCHKSFKCGASQAVAEKGREVDERTASHKCLEVVVSLKSSVLWRKGMCLLGEQNQPIKKSYKSVGKHGRLLETERINVVI